MKLRKPLARSLKTALTDQYILACWDGLTEAYTAYTASGGNHRGFTADPDFILWEQRLHERSTIIGFEPSTLLEALWDRLDTTNPLRNDPRFAAWCLPGQRGLTAWVEHHTGKPTHKDWRSADTWENTRRTDEALRQQCS